MANNRRADFALRIMAEMAQLPPGAHLSIRDLCEATDVPVIFGAPLVETFARAGFIRAEGYRETLLSLAVPSDQITVGQIMRLVEPNFSLSQYRCSYNTCTMPAECGVHRMWLMLDDVLWRQFDALTLAEITTPQSPALMTDPLVATSSISTGSSSPFRM